MRRLKLTDYRRGAKVNMHSFGNNTWLYFRQTYVPQRFAIKSFVISPCKIPAVKSSLSLVFYRFNRPFVFKIEVLTLLSIVAVKIIRSLKTHRWTRYGNRTKAKFRIALRSTTKDEIKTKTKGKRKVFIIQKTISSFLTRGFRFRAR